jgi:3-dehydroquinate synthase
MGDRIRVEAPGGAYDIVIEARLLKRAAALVAALQPPVSRVVVVTNATLAPLYGAPLADALGAALVTMGDGEGFKTLDTVAQLYTAFVQAGLDRGGLVIALGGGVVGDSAGFAAATYMRGVRLAQMPTSLLAMVDSSVGGKTGVDLLQGKNLVGAFKQPEAVWIDPGTLATLPAREWRCGMAEVLKHGLLADPALLEPALHTRARAAELVRRAVQVKVDVVTQDPYEQGVRAHLNLGHTFAHAIEQVSGYDWPHGEAVGVGLLAVARLSAALELCGADVPAQVEAALESVGLPRRLGGLDVDALYGAMATDKKWRAGRSRFVVLRGIGQPDIIEGVPRDVVLAELRGLA